MPAVTSKEHLHLNRGCGQCDMCTKCKRKMVEAEERERKMLKLSEITCEKCGLTTKCKDCIACPKCKHRYGEQKSTISEDKFESSISGSSSAISTTSIEAQVGSEEANKSLVTADPGKLAVVQKTEYQKEAEHMANWYPPHIDPKKHPLIPIPHPPAQVELRGGRLMPMCLCLKRNGLQSDCPKTGCQGNPQCMRYLVPACIPSGFTLADPKDPYLQKADEPECYSKAELLKLQAPTAVCTAGDTGEPKPSTPTEDDQDRQLVIASDLKVVRLIPNEPPNYISEPPVDDYKAPCRRHGKYGVPGSGKYTKFARCRLRDGKTLPKIIVPGKSRS